MSHFALNSSALCLVFVHRTESLVAEPRLTHSACNQERAVLLHDILVI